MKISAIFCIFLAFFPAAASSLVDLNNFQEDFVLETKQLSIPGYPNAFNPSIVEWQGKYLLAFRTYEPVTGSTDEIRLVWLDDNFDPAGPVQLLIREGEIFSPPSRGQDPRPIVINEDLFIVYNNFYPLQIPQRRVIVGQVKMNEEGDFFVANPSYLLYFEGENYLRQEKNWVPFVYQNVLLLAYSLNPHRIFCPNLETHSCTTYAETTGNITSDWGVLRGGTQAQLVDGAYLGFYHSCKAMATVQSGQAMMVHYFMGAYTFQADYPFALTALSPNPIVHQSFYEGPMYNTWKPLRVVFPMNYIVDGDFIWVSYGRQDHEAWLVKLDKNKLFASLRPVETLNPGD